jgi:hypothetical protein
VPEPDAHVDSGVRHRGGDDDRDRDDCDRRERDTGGRSNAARNRPDNAGALEYPAGLSRPETAAAKWQLAGLPGELAQELLDELAGRMAGEGIRGSPLSYLRGLLARAKEGAFTPEVAVSVATARE